MFRSILIIFLHRNFYKQSSGFVRLSWSCSCTISQYYWQHADSNIWNISRQLSSWYMFLFIYLLISVVLWRSVHLSPLIGTQRPVSALLQVALIFVCWGCAVVLDWKSVIWIESKRNKRYFVIDLMHLRFSPFFLKIVMKQIKNNTGGGLPSIAYKIIYNPNRLR